MNSSIILHATLAITLSAGLAPAQQAATADELTKTMNAIRLRQSDLDEAWAKYNFVETYRLENLPPAPKPVSKTTYVYNVHQIGNSELFQLVTFNGKPLDEKLQKQWDKYEQKQTRQLGEHPRSTEQHSRHQMLCTDVATQILRTLQPLSMTYERSPQNQADLIIQAKTDEEKWAAFNGNTLYRKLVGSIRADAKTFTLKEIILRAANGDSFNGGVIRVDPGLRIVYRQSEIDHQEVPHLEIYGVMGRILKDRYQTSEVWDFSNFVPTAPAKP